MRELLTSSINEESMVTGGNNIEVEIYETKMGKRKYHRGHKVEGVWVVAGVERTAEKKIFAVMVEDRTESTLNEIIMQHVHPGSKVLTDGWKAYKGALEKNNLSHSTVNHSLNFKDPYTGVHTNTIEGFNNAFKSFVKPRHRTRKDVESHLLTYIWFKQNKTSVWSSFLNALTVIEYG